MRKFEICSIQRGTGKSHPHCTSNIVDNEKKLLLLYRTRHNLRVREHTILGPYVDGLSVLAVSSHEVI